MPSMRPSQYAMQQRTDGGPFRKRLPKSPCMTQNGISSPSESRRTADNPWPDLIRRHEKPRLSR